MQGTTAPFDPTGSTVWLDSTAGLTAPIVSSAPTLAVGGAITWGFQSPHNGTLCFTLSSISMALGTVNATSVPGVTVALALYEGDASSSGNPGQVRAAVGGARPGGLLGLGCSYI